MTAGQDRVAVAVSGGADSLLALALLQEAGYELFAVHGHFFPPDETALEREQMLQEQCAGLGLALHVLDLRQAFYERVIAPFARAYAAGLTPNPCGLCNPRIKFGLLFDQSRTLGAAHIATGHYVRRSPYENCGVLLRRGLDPGKDQSYFLALTPPERLAKALFPLGESYKAKTLAALQARGLQPPNAVASREICFIPDNNYRAFLQQAAAALSLDLPGEGPILLQDGPDSEEKVGRHQGLWRYTLGQRRGLGVVWKAPLYVLAKDMRRNALIVGPEHRQYTRTCAADACVFHAPPEAWPEELLVQTRYRQRAAPAAVRALPQENRLEITFCEPHALPAPGQLAVVYAATGHVLGAGIIDGDAP